MPATLPEELLAIMSREDGTQAEDRVRTEAPAGIQAEVPDKAVAIDGKIKKPGPEGPAFLGLNKYAKSSDPFHENWTVLTMAKILTKYRGLK